MSDLLVPLYKLPLRGIADAKMAAEGVVIRRPLTYEMSKVTKFIVLNFSQQWADETAATFSRQPVSSFVALEHDKIVGFAAFETTTKAFFGPTGVAESHRKRGIGGALLIASLWGLHDFGYAYGFIGGAGPVDFYMKTVPSMAVVEGSEPGIYPRPIIE
jgi:GNAT superfamily N-acetyltransferase